MSNGKRVKRHVVIYEDPDFADLLLNFDALAVEIKKIKTDHPEYFNIGFVHNRWYDKRYHSYSIIGDRYETDKEFEQRIARKKKRAESEAKRKATVLKNKEKELQKLKEQVSRLEKQIGV